MTEREKIVKKYIPEKVQKRFKELNERAKSGERKKWILLNSSGIFEPFEKFEEKTDALFNSPMVNELIERAKDNV